MIKESKPITLDSETAPRVINGRQVTIVKSADRAAVISPSMKEAILNGEPLDHRSSELILSSCPIGIKGDKLWVRESFEYGLCTKSGIAYRATHKPSDLEDGHFEPIQWRPATHLPKMFSRMSLTVKDVSFKATSELTINDAKDNGFDSIEDFTRDLKKRNKGVKPRIVWIVSFSKDIDLDSH